MVATTVTNFVMSFLVTGSLSLLWGMLGFVLIIAHIPLISIRMPPNGAKFYEYINEVAKFDPIPTDDFYDNLFRYLNFNSISPNFEALGYES